MGVYICVSLMFGLGVNAFWSDILTTNSCDIINHKMRERECVRDKERVRAREVEVKKEIQ